MKTVTKQQSKAKTKAKILPIVTQSVTHDAILALDSMAESGGFFTRGIEYHLGKGNVFAKESKGILSYSLKGMYLLERVARPLLDSVRVSRMSGKAINGHEFIKTAKGAPYPYQPMQLKGSQGKAISQAHFSALFVK